MIPFVPEIIPVNHAEYIGIAPLQRFQRFRRGAGFKGKDKSASLGNQAENISRHPAEASVRPAVSQRCEGRIIGDPDRLRRADIFPFFLGKHRLLIGAGSQIFIIQIHLVAGIAQKDIVNGPVYPGEQLRFLPGNGDIQRVGGKLGHTAEDAAAAQMGDSRRPAPLPPAL